jgi:hypothetical protein
MAFQPHLGASRRERSPRTRVVGYAAMAAWGVYGGWLGAHLALRWGPQPGRRLLFVVVTGLGAKFVYDAEQAWVPRHGSPTPDR